MPDFRHCLSDIASAKRPFAASPPSAANRFPTKVRPLPPAPQHKARKKTSALFLGIHSFAFPPRRSPDRHSALDPARRNGSLFFADVFPLRQNPACTRPHEPSALRQPFSYLATSFPSGSRNRRISPISRLRARASSTASNGNPNTTLRPPPLPIHATPAGRRSEA